MSLAWDVVFGKGVSDLESWAEVWGGGWKKACRSVS